MSQRRMFSPKITSSDLFLDMPPTSRELYFQLGMNADDDGFVNPKRIVRMIGSTEDDLKILIAKKFVLLFENGVVVITDWKVNNLIRKDWYQPTIYINEKMALRNDENGRYHFVNESVNAKLPNSSTQVRLGKVRLGKNTLAPKPAPGPDPDHQHIVDIIDAFAPVNPHYQNWYGNKNQRAPIKRMLAIHGKETILKVLKVLPQSNKITYIARITTPTQLEAKWADLEADLQKYKAKQAEKKPNVIII